MVLQHVSIGFVTDLFVSRENCHLSSWSQVPIILGQMTQLLNAEGPPCRSIIHGWDLARAFSEDARALELLRAKARGATFASTALNFKILGFQVGIDIDQNYPSARLANMGIATVPSFAPCRSRNDHRQGENLEHANGLVGFKLVGIKSNDFNLHDH